MTTNVSGNDLFEFLMRHAERLSLRNVQAGKEYCALAELQCRSRVESGPILALKREGDAHLCQVSVLRSLPSPARSFSAKALPELLINNDGMQCGDESDEGVASVCFSLATLALETVRDRPLSSDHIIDAVALRLPMLTAGMVHASRDPSGDLVFSSVVALCPSAFPEQPLLAACKALCGSVAFVRRIYGFLWEVAEPQASATHNALLAVVETLSERAQTERREGTNNGPKKTKTVSI